MTVFRFYYTIVLVLFVATTIDKPIYASSPEINDIGSLSIDLKIATLETRKWVSENGLVKYKSDFDNQIAYLNDNRSKLLKDKNQFNWSNKTISINNNHNKMRYSKKSNFGFRIHPITGLADHHNGIDIPLNSGTPVYAFDNGTIDVINVLTGINAGKFIIIKHSENSETRYLHLSEIIVTAGQKVNKGDVIAYSGSTGRTTGPHLHFEYRESGIPFNPLEIGDVRWYIKKY